MRTKTNRIAGVFFIIGCLAAGSMEFTGACLAQTNAPNLSPAVREVVKLTQAHMSDEIIVAYIKNSGAAYALRADDVLYLSGQGVSQTVLAALLQSKAAPVGPAPRPQAQAPDTTSSVTIPTILPPPNLGVAPPNADSTHTELAPYGTWMDVPGFGSCWRPAESIADPYWRPYCDHGHWVYTENGWFWQSEYPWGDLVFHHGRWFKSGGIGWAWQPGYAWAPAWVCWRHTDGYCGWAPLPPAARFDVGAGLMYNGRPVLNFDFGLAEDAFVFVPYDHFWDFDLHGFVVPRSRIGPIFLASRLFNNYRIVNGRFFNEGIGRDRISLYTRREIRVERPISRWYR